MAELYEDVFRSNNSAGNETILKDLLTGVTVLGIPSSVSMRKSVLFLAERWPDFARLE